MFNSHRVLKYFRTLFYFSTKARKTDLQAHIQKGYTFKGDSITLGGAIFNGEPVEDALIKVPLKTLNRHGLIAGATGTGKTKSLQVMAEELSKKGVPSLLMDIKGDLSGLAAPGENNKHIKWRHGSIGIPYNAEPMPVELMTLTQEGKGTRLKATVSEFGPILLSKILGLNDTQSSIVSLLFMYCDDNNLPLIDLKDLRKSLQYINGNGKDAIEEEYGMISGASVSTIMRKVIELEQQGADEFFGERSFEVKDLVRTAENYPLSDFYNTDELITQLGIGEALITALNEKGIPTPLAATLCRAPATRMDVLSPLEVDNIIKTSEIRDKYNEEIDRESAYEILTDKIKQAKEDARIAELEAIREKEEEELRKKEEARRIKEEKEWEKRQAKLEREEERELLPEEELPRIQI